MTKSLMISIQPKHLVNILNGTKTLELRKSVPKDYVGWVYVYVTNGVGKSKYHHLYNLTEYNNGKTLFSITHHNKHSLVPDGFLNGKVVARFWFDECDMYYFNEYQNEYRLISQDKNRFVSAIMGYDELCLTENQANEYGKGKTLYAWHIKQLEIFDEPKELSEFYKTNITYIGISEIEYALDYYGKEKVDNILKYSLKRAPQSWQYVYVKE